jgi:hypothetical protein
MMKACSAIKQKVNTLILFKRNITHMCAKIHHSIQLVGRRGAAKAPLSIGELTKSLASAGMEITSLHWARIAFLVRVDKSNGHLSLLVMGTLTARPLS